MTRKRKILFVAAFIGLVITTMVFLARSKQPEMAITRVWPDRVESRVVWIVVTNQSDNIFHYAFLLKDNQGRWLRGGGRKISPRTELKDTTVVFSTNQWQLSLLYWEEKPPSFLMRTQKKFGQFLLDHKFDRLGLWFCTHAETTQVYGPLMDGNKPMPDHSKQSVP